LVISGVMLMSDETILKKLPEEIRQHIEHLERIRSDFVANVSHELRTPLTVFRGYLETLIANKAKAPEGWDNIFQQMLQHSSRMEHLISDLLLLSRIEVEEVHDAPSEQVDVPYLLSELQQTAKEYSDDDQHELTFNVDSSLMLGGAEDELKSLFSNLIINAIKYTPAGGAITVTWSLVNSRPIFQVEDAGIGISAKHIPRLTERFYRIDKARSRDSGGTGLGLAIVKHVLLRHSATLEIESVPDKGSTFRCLF
jgi:two-component system phosphate regulon sensor histidine kinase PhoR